MNVSDMNIAKWLKQHQVICGLVACCSGTLFGFLAVAFFPPDRPSSMAIQPIDVRVSLLGLGQVASPTPQPQSQIQGSWLGKFLAEQAAEALRAAMAKVGNTAGLPQAAADEFVKKLSGSAGDEAGKKVVDGFSDLIGALFKSQSDAKPDPVSVAATFVVNMVSDPNVSAQTGLSQEPKVKISERVFFEYDRSDLGSDARSVLTRIRTFAMSNTAAIILLSSNADTKGTPSYNVDLARRRSAAVRDELAKGGGIALSRIFATDLGNTAMPVLTASDTKEPANRSVTIQVRD